KIFSEAFRRLETFVANSCSCGRTHDLHEDRQLCFTPDQQQSRFEPLRDEPIKGQQKQIDAFSPNHLAAKQECRRTAPDIRLSLDGEKLHEIAKIRNAKVR